MCAWLISPFTLRGVLCLSIVYLLLLCLVCPGARTRSLPARTCESSERRKEDEEQERKWGKAATKHGAMGDVVSDVLAHFQ